ncbi:hypothetical protein DLJ53_01035 [Acuticoccus sediminis]|uniref:Phytase-like domain-containing protein n=1 Tax=Acuticoccus sediminis TaxID=2184697 RepID=A0A8B2NZM5_9HYPH|nr:hypothetical protein DLJ53_01035 [Acuticoccus sediminis]
MAAICVAAAITAGPGALAGPIDVRTRVIETFGGNAEADGRLAFLGGLVLSGPRDFGAWSGMLVDGDRFLAVNDTGLWLTGRMLIEDGRLAGVADLELYPRRDELGRPITSKRNGDAESLTRVPGGVLVAVETKPRIYFYPADGIDVDFEARAERRDLLGQAAIGQLRRFGFEALATTADGTVIAMAEGGPSRAKLLPAYRLPGKGFSLKREADWSITGADMLPGGDMILLERRYGGGIDIGMRVRRIGSDAVDNATGTVDGPVLIEAGFASEIDNMEAIAATVEDGRLVLTMMSDDNHAFLQRTVMLRFAVRDPLPRPNPLRDGSQSG